MPTQQQLDETNAAFWDELCGSELARSIDLRDDTPAELDRFDREYWRIYPYLDGYLSFLSAGDRVLEVGTGYGTVGRALIERGCVYHAVDIADGPISMAKQSLVRGRQDPEQARRASVLDLPFGDAVFDAFVAVGSVHHTGDVQRALSELRRVTRPGGHGLVMVYNARSANRLVTTPVARLAARLVPSRRAWILSRTQFDRNAEGEPAPHTDFLTRAKLESLTSGFSTAVISSENANALTVLGHTLIPRDLLLPTLGRVAGLDLYARLGV